MKTLVHPTYFPSIATFVAMVKGDQVEFEAQDNFQKQTYRNRAYIYGANGKLTLNVPVHHTQKKRERYQDVKIANEENWQVQHWKSIESAYRTSPFFEFYEHEIRPLFEGQRETLFDFNLEGIKVVANCIEFELDHTLSQTFEKERTTGYLDMRGLVDAKKEPDYRLQEYTQVFSDKHGFIADLSILDLLFNEGPNCMNYLLSQSI